jgi:hypothetical protein
MHDPFGIPLESQITVGDMTIDTAAPPATLTTLPEVGLLCANGIAGQILHRERWQGRSLYEARATKTPGGDILVMFPDGGHYGKSDAKVNDMLAYRSSDGGRTWAGPTVAFDIDYDQHGFIPLIPRGTNRIYAFGTQPIPELYSRDHDVHENAPIGFRYSDDDGHTWSDVELIRPTNDPGFLGMSVMRMCETDMGTWILGSHDAHWEANPLATKQYLLRSEDRGATWELLPGARPEGWCVPEWLRMDEGRPIALGNGELYAMFRTPMGRLWDARSTDDGKTWTDPAPTTLIHPDAPPMLFTLSDGHTLAAFHHNRYCSGPEAYDGLTPGVFLDRAEIWVSLSRDYGRTWSEPRFVFANALTPTLDNAFQNYQCSYLDMIVDDGTVHLFLPHRWERITHLTFDESRLETFPTKDKLSKM